ncbi:MAG: helix-turn-helix domain-containing protein [Actinomycetota bacterium]|nr:MAG: helix-turn-helix domain-containing protein [Actinomycetota bacterium]
MASNKVEQLRMQRGMSLSGLARIAGISRQSLYAIEAGIQVPKVYLAMAIASALGTDVVDVFPSDPPGAYRFQIQRGTAGAVSAYIAEVDGEAIVRQSFAAGFAAPPAAGDAVVRIVNSNYVVESQIGRSGMFIDGCDPVLGLISSRMTESSGSFKVRWFYGSNRVSLANLHGKLTHCALVHGEVADMDDEVGTSKGYLAVPFGRWELALCFLPDNPKQIRSLADLLRPDIRFASREEGSGVRHFVDQHLADVGTETALVRGLSTFGDHYQVAAAVELGLCDAGIVPASIAESQGLGFVPVGEHQSSLVFSKDGYGLASDRGILDLLNSASFAKEVAIMGGYQLVG